MTSIATSAPAPVAVESLSVITYQNRPVITTELLAQLYGTGESNIHDNYRKNVDRFTEGKHFVKLEGDALREFKKSVTGKFPVSGRARNLTLWTERGAARHAKMLDTDQAWEVFEKLEDSYFSRPERTPYVQNPGDSLTVEQADVLRTMLTEAAKKLPKAQQGGVMVKGWSKLKSHFKCGYRKIPQAEFTEAVSILARHISTGELLDAEPAKKPAPSLMEMMQMERVLVERDKAGVTTFTPIGPLAIVVEMHDMARIEKLVGIIADFVPRQLLPQFVAAARRRIGN